MIGKANGRKGSKGGGGYGGGDGGGRRIRSGRRVE